MTADIVFMTLNQFLHSAFAVVAAVGAALLAARAWRSARDFHRAGMARVARLQERERAAAMAASKARHPSFSGR